MSAVGPESERLLNAYRAAVQELFMFQEQHFAALIERNEVATRYELLIHIAGERAGRQVRLFAPSREAWLARKPLRKRFHSTGQNVNIMMRIEGR